MSILVIRFAVAVAAMLGSFATSFLRPHADVLASRAADGTATVFVAVVLAGRMLIPVLTAWLPSLYAGGACVCIAVLASWPAGFGLPLDEWFAHGKLNAVGHAFGLLFTAAAMTITTLMFLTPPGGLS